MTPSPIVIQSHNPYYDMVSRICSLHEFYLMAGDMNRAEDAWKDILFFSGKLRAMDVAIILCEEASEAFR